MPRSRRRCGSHSGLARCPGSEGRCESRGRFGEAGKARRRGIVGAIPRRSNAASVVETPPNLVTDFGFGTLAPRLQAERRVDLAQSLELLVEPVDVLLHLGDVPAELAEWPKRPAPFLGHVRSRGGALLPERAAQVARPENANHRGDAQPSTDSSVEHAFLPVLRCEQLLAEEPLSPASPIRPSCSRPPRAPCSPR